MRTISRFMGMLPLRARVTLMQLTVLSVLIVATFAIPGCASNPVTHAKTLRQQAYALYGQYVIFQGKAAELKQDSVTPARVKLALSAADKTTYPLAEQLIDSVATVDDLDSILSACPPNDQQCVVTNKVKLDNAVLHLSDIYFRARPAVLQLVAVVEGAK